MRALLLAALLVTLSLAAAPPAAGLNSCITAEGVVLCTASDWDDPAACLRVDVELPTGSAGTGTCVHG